MTKEDKNSYQKSQESKKKEKPKEFNVRIGKGSCAICD